MASPAGTGYVAIAATFTAEPVREFIQFWLGELGWEFPVKFAQYNQVFQQLLDPLGLFAGNRGGVNVVLVRYEDWLRFSGKTGGSLKSLEANVANLISSVKSAADLSAAPLVVGLCPASPEFLADQARASFVARMNELLAKELSDIPAVQFFGPEDLNREYPVKECHDEHGDELGHVPYTGEFFAALGTMVARKVNAIRMTPHKVIVLDCDDTLWQGICGEDGPEGVSVDEPRQEMQRFLVAQHDAGMLLCLCSKNNEEDVLETFRCKPGMPLKLDHFVARRVNWEPKSTNLLSLADDLELGLDSFIFIDDNPKECAEVQANTPEVLALPLPHDAEKIPGFLKSVWAFDHAHITEEDRRRTALYSQRLERSRLEKQAAGLEDFLSSLQLEVSIRPLAPAHLPRAAQLTQRTNQMNCTTVRRTESDIQRLVRSKKAECLTVEVRDRFGSYGITGLVIFRTAGGSLQVDTFLLSCRVLGRGVEHRVLCHLGDIALSRGQGFVEVPFAPTPRNRPALKFLESTGAPWKESRGPDFLFRYPAAEAARMAYKPGEAVLTESGTRGAPQQVPVAAQGKLVDWTRLAALSEPAAILEHVRSRRAAGGTGSDSGEEPRTPLERQLVALWSDLLGRTAVGIHHNFFDLGGHSLLAVQLLSRVRQMFAVDLSLEVVYGGAFTVENLARAIELKEIEKAGVDEYEALLAELENLPEDEVRALLAEEESAQG